MPRMYWISFLAMALLLAGIAAQSAAMIVEVPLEFNENATMSQTLADAQKGAFIQAVLQESLRLLPAPLDPARQALLEEFLAERAGDFVLGYKDAGSAPAGETGMLALDVSVDSSGLGKLLTSLGLYSNILGTMPFTLEKESLPAEGLMELSLLQTLSGLREEQGAMPVLSLRHAGKMWSGRLKTESSEYIGQSETLDMLWTELWGQYFSRVERKVSFAEKVELTVSGWYSPDGAEAFQRVLKSWGDAVGSADLQGVVISGQGVQATWRLDLKSRSLLQSRLEDYLPQRELVFQLSEPGATGQ